ncbi:hypothetical protein ABPG75_009741 [Micractinium tetrahymenae]
MSVVAAVPEEEGRAQPPAGAGDAGPGDRQRAHQAGPAAAPAQTLVAGGGGGGGGNTATPVPWPLRSTCAYQACYCEENVWLLARSLQASHAGSSLQLFAVFVSNHSKTVPLWRQRAAAHPDSPVVWDYHVFLLARPAQGPALVLDLDSTLEPFPCTLGQYRRGALLGSAGGLPAQYQRCYRVVPAQLFLAHFASDRSHMREAGGGWLQPPPPWPPIAGAAAAVAAGATSEEGYGSGTSVPCSNTLPAFLAFPPVEQLAGGERQPAAAPWLGSVMSERALLAAFGAG